ncbi:uncharacterized protein [Littorina saxatilis]|uniref:uncharacterized protein n=1 Tax=Littorina saxatilis TaxID=31220 RepID=UPI0038B668B6
MCTNNCCGACCCTRKFAYIAGMVVIAIALKMSLWGTFFLAWVYREGGTAITAETVEYYGLWTACSPSEFDVCRHIFDGMPEVESATRGCQALIVLYFSIVVVCFVFELVSCFPCFGLKGKFSIIFDNRIVEYIISVAAVLGFLGMLVFAAEVKNKASRGIGQEDQTAWGFGFSLSSQIFTVMGCCLLACGRTVSTTTV